MSSHRTIRIRVPAPIGTPRGAQWAADAALWLLRRVGRPVWQAMQAAGQRRATREMQRIGPVPEQSDPALARALHDAILFDLKH